MGFHRSVLWVAMGGVIGLVIINVWVDEPILRSALAVLAITPLLYVTVRVALGSERRVAQERRKFLKLRNVTDEFILNVRTLNRLSVAAKAEDAPAGANDRIDEIVARMHALVDRMRGAAGNEDGFVVQQDAG